MPWETPSIFHKDQKKKKALSCWIIFKKVGWYMKPYWLKKNKNEYRISNKE
jgi:hypothetical protein